VVVTEIAGFSELFPGKSDFVAACVLTWPFFEPPEDGDIITCIGADADVSSVDGDGDTGDVDIPRGDVGTGEDDVDSDDVDADDVEAVDPADVVVGVDVRLGDKFPSSSSDKFPPSTLSAAITSIKT